MRMLLWNTRRVLPDRQAQVAKGLTALAQQGVDLFLLVEPPMRGTDAYAALLQQGFSDWNNTDRFAVFSRFDASFAEPLRFIVPPERYTGWQVSLPGLLKLNLFMVHAYDRFYREESDRMKLAGELRQDIEYIENIANAHDRTIVVGDFNDNPYDTSLVGFEQLNATNSRRVAQKLTRKVTGTERKVFFNATWPLLCDKDDVAGTYRLQNPSADKLHWHAYDQILVRPSLMNLVPSDGLKLLTRIGDQSMLSTRERRPAISDHLPIQFELNIEQH